MNSDGEEKKGIFRKSGWLTGQMLVAMPSMMDPRFVRSVIYLCQHSLEGAMGLVVNKLYDDLDYRGLLTQLKINVTPSTIELPIHFGGPVDPARGFVLHSSDYSREGTLRISDTISLTATIEILQAISEGRGPERAILALGYSGWAPGQLDAELQTTGWLVVPPDEEIIFGIDHEKKWEKALAKIGISPNLLSTEIGHA